MARIIVRCIKCGELHWEEGAEGIYGVPLTDNCPKAEEEVKDGR